MNATHEAIINVEYRAEVNQLGESAKALCLQHKNKGVLGLALDPQTADEVLVIVKNGKQRLFPALDAFVLAVGVVAAAKFLVKEARMAHDYSVCQLLRS